jgi:hypothetical protein
MMDALIITRIVVGIMGVFVLATGIRMLWKGSKKIGTNIGTSAYIVLGSAAVEYALRFSRFIYQDYRLPAVNEGTLGAGMTALAAACFVFISVRFALELIFQIREDTVKNGILKRGKERAAYTAVGIILACLIIEALGSIIYSVPDTLFDAMKRFNSGDMKRAGAVLCLQMLAVCLYALIELFFAEFPEPRDRQKAISTLDELIEGEQKYREKMKALMVEYRKKGISCRALDELCLDLMSESLMKQSEYTAKKDAMRETH